MSKYILWLATGLIGYSEMACAQSLQPNDLVWMLKSGATQIDSLAKARGFKEVATSLDSTATAVTYVYQANENATKVQRLLIGGRHHSPDYVEWQYSVWQEKDALDWTSQLQKAAFTRAVLGTTDARGQPPITSIVFRKGNKSIFCEEQLDSNAGRKRYKFVISTKYYKNDAR